ncbi:hypothetical protein DID75_01040 [Candidatus Marinamargulisbacteria bacterium SCGC AG-410-N11]|nr:hypothetical protein DID75_01040 [Candidatus Marinamargulisbacteria bacterium SCGC AG-410-N11]
MNNENEELLHYQESIKLSSRLIISKKLAIVGALISCPYIFLFSYFKITLLTYYIPFSIGWFLLTLFFLKINKNNLARLNLVVCSCTGLTIFSAFCGKEAGIHLVFFAMIILPMILFEFNQRIWIFVSSIFPVVGLISSQTLILEHLPKMNLSYLQTNICYYSFICVTVLVLILEIRFFCVALNGIEQKMITMFQQNRKLMDHTHKVSQQVSYATLTKGIAHEIRNPMAILHTSAEILKEYKNVPDTIQELFDSIQSTIKRILKITDTLLRYGDLSSNEQTIFSVHPVIKDCIRIIKNQNQHKKIDFFTNLQAQLLIKGVPNLIYQILQNILINSMEAISEKGNITITTEDMDLNQVNNKITKGVVITIEDSGCGIALGSISQVVNPFYSTKKLAMGLGLSKVDQIIQEHGGKLKIKSTLNKGTKVSIYLPSCSKKDLDASNNIEANQIAKTT